MISITRKQALERLGLDTIITMECWGNYCEVVGRKGGDVLTFRIYESGMITER